MSDPSQSQAGPSRQREGSSISAKGNDAKGSEQPKDKRKLACMPCRDIKAKCIYATPTSAPLDPCQRCLRLKLQCYYVPKKPPTKYKSLAKQQPQGRDEQDRNSEMEERRYSQTQSLGEASESGSARRIDGAPSTGPAALHFASDSQERPQYGEGGSGSSIMRQVAYYTGANPDHASGSRIPTTSWETETESDMEQSATPDPLGLDPIVGETISFPSTNTEDHHYRYQPISHRQDQYPLHAIGHATSSSHTYNNPSRSVPSKEYAIPLPPQSTTAPGNMDLLSTISAAISASSVASATSPNNNAFERSPLNSFRAPSITLSTATTSTNAAVGSSRGYVGSTYASAAGNGDGQAQGDYDGGDEYGLNPRKRRRMTTASSDYPNDSHEPHGGGVGRVGASAPLPSKDTNPAFHESYQRRRVGQEEGIVVGPAQDWIGLVLGRLGLSGKEDPIVLGLVTEGDVAFLFDRYHNKLNTYVALLDPALHTPSYVRSISPILFTTICAVTAQAYLPEKYEALATRLRYMLGRAYERCESNLELAQSLSLASVWKDGRASTDASSWMNVGTAIRMGYALGLNAPHKRPLPSDEFQARLVTNRERAWFQLLACDRRRVPLSHLYGYRTRMAESPTPDRLEQWVRDHEDVPCIADVMQAAASPLGRVMLALSQHPNEYRSREEVLDFLNDMTVEVKAWEDKWFGPRPPGELHPTSRAIIGFYVTYVRFEIAVIRCRHDGGARENGGHNDTVQLGQAINSALAVLEFICQRLSVEDVLVFAPDVVPIKAARSAVYLIRHLDDMDPSAAYAITNAIKAITEEFKRYIRGRNTAYFQYHFFMKLLDFASPSATRQVSRRASPAPDRGEIRVDGEPNRDDSAPAFANSLDAGMAGNAQEDDPLIFSSSGDLDLLLINAQSWFSDDILTGISGLT